MPDNPFVYGEIVQRPSFVDREVELQRLVADLASGQKVFLISPRRYGKSSLVHQAFAVLARRRIVTLEFTVSSFSSYVAFLEGYAKALVALESKTGPARSWLRDLFTSVKPEIRMEPKAAGSGLTEALSSRSASEKPLGSVTPFACAHASHRSTLCTLLFTIWVRCTVAGLEQRSHLSGLAMKEEKGSARNMPHSVSLASAGVVRPTVRR